MKRTEKQMQDQYDQITVSIPSMKQYSTSKNRCQHAQNRHKTGILRLYEYLLETTNPIKRQKIEKRIMLKPDGELFLKDVF